MKIMAVISLKPSSTRIPRKNFAEIVPGEPLYQMAFRKAQALLDAQMVAGVAVCSSEDVRHLLPPRFLYVRVPEQYEKSSRALRVWENVLKAVPGMDAVLTIPCTSPLLSVKTLAKIIDRLKNGSHSVRAAYVRRTVFFQEDPEGGIGRFNFSRFTGTQNISPVCIGGYAFGFSREYITEMENEYSEKEQDIVPVPWLETMDIDYPEEFQELVQLKKYCPEEIWNDCVSFPENKKNV